LVKLSGIPLVAAKRREKSQRKNDKKPNKKKDGGKGQRNPNP